MNSFRREPLLLLGDVSAFLISLWIALLVRFMSVPSVGLYVTHLKPFGFIFILWILVFFIAGLYDKHTSVLRRRLPATLFNAQIANSALAIAFFYVIPYFGITPKTILFIDLVVSFLVILGWRMYGYAFLTTREPEKAILIGSGEEMRELLEEVNNNPLHNITFITSVDLSKVDDEVVWDEIVSRIFSENVSIIAIDLMHTRVGPVLPHLYNLIFSKVAFVDMHKIYEDIFDRVPLSLLRYNWFLENISSQTTDSYDVLKRVMDLVIALAAGIVSLVVYPFVILAIKLDDGGVIFSHQKRVGKNNQLVTLLKFRTMTVANDNGEWQTLPGLVQNAGPIKNEVTRVGKFLRKTRLDELPQLWNVVKGDISLIGPRPEFSGPVKQYSEEIPYYNIRHIIKPGLSGWAQIYGEHAHHGTDVGKTKNKLSYDLYYIKNRSFLLDIKIALKTVKTLLSRSGI
jgi:exopolysaccharide biosynthesis polyprenyl glycosylphosphotransferase